MKVLFICAAYPLPPATKRDRRLLNIMKQLRKQGHTLYYAGFSSNPKPDKNPLFRTLCVRTPAGEPDFKHKPEPVFREQIYQETLKLAPELIFVYGIEAAPLAPFEAHIPSVADFRRCEYITVQKENAQGGFLQKLTGAVEWSRIASLETSLASKFATVFLPRERDVYYLNKQSALNLTVLPEAIDTELYDIEAWEPQFDRLLWTGSVMEEGNFNAVKRYKDLYGKEFYRQGAILYVTGKYQEAHKNALFCDYIQPLGFIKDMREAYKISQAVVIPISGGIGAVGKITEAMACGVPVISTRDGAEGLRLSGKDECILIANTPEEMIKAWERLGDRDFADGLRRNARRFVEENYSWAANGSLLKEELDKAVR